MVEEDLERDDDDEYLSDMIDQSETKLVDSIRDEEYTKIKKKREEDKLQAYL